ncbi:MAG: DUF4838 domain-containing protein [Lentisphaeria bacterium]|nr:DUF4838 domain-containing protein [Lentisphaeria bacterium]
MNPTKLFLLTAGAFTLLTFTADGALTASRFNPKPVSPRSVKVGTEPVHTLAAGGRAQCEIVIPEKANATEKYAAKELSGFLEKIIGSKVPVTSKPTGGKTAFLLGSAGAKAAGIDLQKIDRDGFVIKSAGKNIAICGNDDPKGNPAKQYSYNERGTLNGVYEFLERFGGVRFYFPGEIGTVVPSKPDWKIGEIDLTDRPDNQHRRTYCKGLSTLGTGKLGVYGGFTQGDLTRLSGLRIRESTLRLPNCHGLRGLDLPRRFAKTHPDYFALMDNGRRHDGSVSLRADSADGHLCFSNEGLKEVVYQDAKAFLTGQPASSRGLKHWKATFFSQPFFNIMPNDALYYCRCENCKKLAAQLPGGKPDVIWKFETDIARRLQQENVPGYITLMAYSSYKKIPSMDIPLNAIVMLAVTGPWKESNPKQEDDIQLLKDWNKKLNAKTYLWTYTTKCGNLIADVPSFTPRSVGSFFRKAAPYSFGAFLESETDFWIFNSMNFYVFGKVMWDSSTDVDALFEEHFRLMYGAAAAQMKDFYDTLERHWVKDIMANIKETKVGPQAVLPSQFDIWTKIYSPAEVARVNKLFDEAEKLTADDPASLKRVRFMRKELWGTVLGGVERFNQFNSDSSLWTIYVPEAGEKITIDGKLDEPAWKKVKPVWMTPRDSRGGGDKAEVHTRVRMLGDADNIYVGIECDEPFTDRMLCGRKDQDPLLWRDNVTELFFAGKPTDEIIYQIILNSDGKICDLRQPGRLRTNPPWRSNAEYKAGVVPGKMWIAEIRIPRASMPELAKDRFLVNFTRGRVLQQPVKVMNYTWSRFKDKQSPEFCGTAIAGTEPETGNLILGGDFDLRQIPNKKNKTMLGLKKPFWYGSDSAGPVFLDREVFRTCGQSARLERPGGSDRLIQYVKGLKSGSKYKLSCFVKLENVRSDKKPQSGFYIQFRFGTKLASTVFRPIRQAFRGDIKWTRLEYTFTVPEGIAVRHQPFLEFRLSANAEGKVWIDHVSVTEIKE